MEVGPFMGAENSFICLDLAQIARLASEMQNGGHPACEGGDRLAFQEVKSLENTCHITWLYRER